MRCLIIGNNGNSYVILHDYYQKICKKENYLLFLQRFSGMEFAISQEVALFVSCK